MFHCPNCNNILYQYQSFWSCKICLHRYEQIGEALNGDEYRMILREIFEKNNCYEIKEIK